MISSSKILFTSSKHESKEQKETMKMVTNGDFDDKIIDIYKAQKLDLKKSVSGADWKNPHSSFRYLAGDIGLDRNDDSVVREIYRILIYNKRSIRDRMVSRDEEYKPLEKVTSIEIPLCAPEPPVRPVFSKVSTQKPEISEKKSSSNQSKPGSTVIVKQQQSMSEVKDVEWGEDPVVKSCPRCNYYGLTKIHFRIGCYTWAWVAGLILSGICMPCSWFPCALDGTKDILHTCPKCLYILGKVPRRPFSKKSSEDLFVEKRGGFSSMSGKSRSITENPKSPKMNSKVETK